MFSILKPYIFSLDPEVAHDLAIKSLKFNFIPESFFKVANEHVLEQEMFGKKLKKRQKMTQFVGPFVHVFIVKAYAF